MSNPTKVWNHADLREFVAQVVGVNDDQLGDDDDLLQLGLDSLRMIRVGNEFRATGHDIALSTLAERPTVNAWSRLLSGSSAGDDS